MRRFLLPVVLPLVLFSTACRDTDKGIVLETGQVEDTSAEDTGDTEDTGEAVDADGDGVPAEQDCDDTNAEIYPGADESCDGADNDCDGVIDEDDAVDVVTFYADGDGDGFGDNETSVMACEAPVGFSATGGDCDDADPAFHPGAGESDCTDPADYNCDGSVGWADADADGFAACEDCDDADVDVNDNATEICDTIDNDCDGLVDSYDPSVTDASTWYGDADGDGYGGSQFQTAACVAPAGYVASSDDCDDLDATSHPGGTEVCDLADNNCDGVVDEGVEFTWYADGDGDGYGDAATTTDACTQPPGYSANGDDCDDNSASTSPAGLEVCDGADNNCDGVVDEAGALGGSTWYVDADGDGWGVTTGSVVSCSAPSGYAAVDGDCNDDPAAGGADQYPGATETWYDGIDQDCDGFDDDQDEDGALLADDCDDLDAASTIVSEDGDCDGILTAADCDDADATSTAIADDADCDGILTAADCDDGDAASTAVADDADCDGVLTAVDCDDTDPAQSWCRTCNDILAAGLSVGDGDYTIDPVGGDAFVVTCDMTTDGGGWTEIAYTQDLDFLGHGGPGDNWEWLSSDFSLELTDARIQAIQGLSTEGKQRYVGICNNVIHYYYNAGSTYSYAFGFRFLDGTETPNGTSNYSPHVITVPQDGCASNDSAGNTAATGTWFDIESVLVPVINVYSRDNEPSEPYGSSLTANPAWLR